MVRAAGVGRGYDNAPTPQGAPRPNAAPSFDWTGWYFGGHYGYATGYSRWNATQAGGTGPVLTGSIDLTNPLNGYFGDGSYFGGLQVGYNRKIGPRLVLGAEADICLPKQSGRPHGRADICLAPGWSGELSGRRRLFGHGARAPGLRARQQLAALRHRRVRVRL